MRMRTRDALALASATGLLAAGVGWDGIGGPTGLLAVAVFGAALGASVGAFEVAALARPRALAAGLVASLILTNAPARWLGIPALGDLLGLLVPGAIAALLLRPETRGALRPSLAHAAIAVYALAALAGVVMSPTGAHLSAWLDILTPVLLYVVGLLLLGTPSGDIGAGEARRFEWTTWAISIATFAVALDMLIFGPGGEIGAGGDVAGLVGMALVVALAWDTRHLVWKAALGEQRGWARVGVCSAAIVYAAVLCGALGRLGMTGAILAASAGLVAVAAARRRLTEVAAVLTIGLLILGIVARGWTAGVAATVVHAFDGNTWGAALSAASERPLGGGMDLAVTQGSLYVTTLRELGLLGLLALLAVLGFATAQCWTAYHLLRPASGQAGTALAGLGVALFTLVGGLFIDPLRSPATGTLFWLFLGMAGATAEAARRRPAGAAITEALRAHPLRVAYVAFGSDAGEVALALGDYLAALDRRRVQPLLVTLGDGPLARLALGLNATAHVIDLLPRPVSLAQRPFVERSAALRRLAASRVGMRLVQGHDALCEVWRHLRQWACLTRTLLDLQPDITVSTHSSLHLATLAAGRVAAAPVQWHARDLAPERLQRRLDTFASWTAGVLAPTQAIARTYGPRQIGTLVRVLRPSIPTPSGSHLSNRAAVRRALGVAEDATLVAVVGPVTAESGHETALDAALLLLGRWPRLRVVMVDEALVGAGTARETSTREHRLGASIRMHGLEGVATLLGARPNSAEIIGACDVAAFPQWSAPVSRGLLQAMGQGVPIVATRVDAHQEQLAEAWGFELADPRDEESLATALEKVLSSLPLYQANARRNPGLVRDWFATAIETARLHALYTALCLPADIAPATLASAPANSVRRWVAALWEPQPAE